MSASEIIEQIKALPAHEREEVAEFIRTVKDSRMVGAKPSSLDVAELVRTANDSQEVRYADEKQFEVSSRRVFETHDELLKRLAK